MERERQERQQTDAAIALKRRISSPHAPEDTEAFLPAEEGLQSGVTDSLPEFQGRGIRSGRSSNDNENPSEEAAPLLPQKAGVPGSAAATGEGKNWAARLDEIGSLLRGWMREAESVVDSALQEAHERVLADQEKRQAEDFSAEDPSRVSTTLKESKEAMGIIGHRMLAYLDEVRGQLARNAEEITEKAKHVTSAIKTRLKDLQTAAARESTAETDGAPLPEPHSFVEDRSRSLEETKEKASASMVKELTQTEIAGTSSRQRRRIRHDSDEFDPSDPLGLASFQGQSATHMGATAERDY